MNSGRTVFAQLMDFLPHPEFQKCVDRYGGEYKTKSFTCFDQFLSLAFAQLTFRESLRDIEACLRAVGPKLYHMGFRGGVSRNTLANANAVRDWRIYQDFALELIRQARELYVHDEFGVRLSQTVYAFDASTIDLCLSVFPWAKFRSAKGGVKLNTLLDLRGPIPTFVHISEARKHEVSALDQLSYEPGAFYILDRGYLDFKRLYRIHQSRSFFVIRAKRNLDFDRRYSAPVKKASGLRFDQTIALSGFYTSLEYPEPLRRVGFVDTETATKYVYLTNNFDLAASTIAKLYRARWQVELFFKWIKQHLRIKAFYGTSENAVKTQIWTAIAVYVLVAIVKKRLGLEKSLYEILQILSVSLLEKIPISTALSDYSLPIPDEESEKQLQLLI
jgi:hypothetical protein